MLTRYSENFSKYLREDGGFISILLILNSPPIAMAFCYSGERFFKSLLVDSIREFYFGAFVILTFGAAIHFGLKNFPRLKFFLQMLILLGFSISFAVDIFLIETFKTTFQPHLIEIAMATNFNETAEFFRQYVLKPKIICTVAAIIFLIVAAIKNLHRIFENLAENKLRRISIYSLIILIPAVVVLIFGSGDFVNGTILGRNLSNIYTAVKTFGSESEIIAELKNSHEKIISNGADIPFVIFVLGEAETRNHMQLYGYKLENNPLLMERYERGELFRFNDVIACANDTSAAMKLIFTFAEKDGVENWYKAANIFDIVRRAGYHTVWISNQSPIGWLGNLDKIYAECCDEKYFSEVTNKAGRSIFTRDFDGVLLPVIDEFISQAHEKNFYCVHLYGSHPFYSERYPEIFSKFTAADEDNPDDFAKNVTAAYDNSILYTDFILDELFKRFEDKNALIVYISDHGQEIFENGRDFAGHSVEDMGSFGMIEIPMLVWASENFREMYPEKIAALKNSVDNPYRTDFIMHAILDLMDIRTENFDATKSITNKDFSEFRRIYNGTIYQKFTQ